MLSLLHRSKYIVESYISCLHSELHSELFSFQNFYVLTVHVVPHELDQLKHGRGLGWMSNMQQDCGSHQP